MASGILDNNINLTIKSNGASGMLDPENVIFYHPLNDNIEHTLNEAWEGSGVFVAGVIGSGVSAVTPSNLFFGDSSGTFNVTGNASRVAIDILEANKIIITAMLPNAGPAKQKAVVANIDGFNITYGPEISVRELNGDIGVVALTPSSVVFASQGDSGKTGKATVGTISGSTITLGSEFAYTSSDFSISMTLSKIDSTRFVVLHMDDLNSFAGTMRIGEVSGTTITYGSELVFNTDTNVFFGRGVASPISESGFLLSYSTLSSGLFSTIVSVSGTTITSLGTPIQVPVSGDNSLLLPTLDTVFMDSTRFALTAGFNNDASLDDQGRIIIGNISGTDITFGTDAIFDSCINSVIGGLFTQYTRVVALDADTGVIGFQKCAAGFFKNSMHTVIFNISGTTITNISSKSRIQDLVSQDIDIVALDNVRVASVVADENIDPTTVDARVGELFEFVSLSSNNSNYPKPIGNKNIATFFWSKNPTKNNAQVRLERGYNITFTSGSIALGGTTATWNSSGIQSLMNVLNDDGEHSLATYFVHQSGTTWKLLTSIDGGSFIDRGVQDVGSQGLLTTNTDAEVFLFDPDDEDQWLDEAVLWAGEPEQFSEFSVLELFKLNRLATILDQPMPSFSSAAFPVSTSGNLVMPTTFNVLQSSGELFIKGHIPVESSVALVTQGPLPSSGNVALIIQGPEGAEMVLVAKGPIPESGNATLFTKGPLPVQSSGTLWVEGIIISNDTIDLVMPLVNDVSQLSGTLFVEGGGLIDNNITLITKGPLAITSSDSGLSLFIAGSSAEAIFDKIIDVFLRTADFNPTVIGLFTPSTSGVTIAVWNVIDGINTQLTIVDAICFAIGDTGRFGWSTENLPVINRNAGQFVFRMTDNVGETFVGEFFLTNPEDGLNNHPDDFDDYILMG